MAEPLDLVSAFRATVSTHGDALALRTQGHAETLTWAEYGRRAERIAAGLAELGLEPGDTVALMLTNRPEFHLLDAAVLLAGGTPFSIYNTLPAAEIAHLLQNAGSRIVVTEAVLAPVLQPLLGDIPTLIVIDQPGLGAHTLADVEDRAGGRSLPVRTPNPDALATIVYTSGTTGPPKGVEITQAAVLEAVTTGNGLLGLPADAHLISYLPMAHIAERIFTHYLPMVFGFSTTTCPDHLRVMEYLVDARPSVFWAPPRLWEKLKLGIEAAMANGVDGRAMLVNLGLDRVVLGAVGAAPCQPQVIQFFMDLGLPLAEAWGMTECCALGTMNVPGAFKLGTVGRAAPGVELRIEQDGEILLRSRTIMRCYRGAPEQTREAVDADGWLHTGDIGRMDDDGYLSIIDRKKEIIINAAGKNMSPANIEAKLKSAGAMIANACVIGDARPYNVALLTLDPFGPAMLELKADGDIPLCEHPAVLSAVSDQVARANQELSRVEQIKRWRLLADEWVPASEELTPTMKLRRKQIGLRYAAEIEALYSPTHDPAAKAGASVRT